MGVTRLFALEETASVYPSIVPDMSYAVDWPAEPNDSKDNPRQHCQGRLWEREENLLKEQCVHTETKPEVQF